jgi:hypothetical protein
MVLRFTSRQKIFNIRQKGCPIQDSLLCYKSHNATGRKILQRLVSASTRIASRPDNGVLFLEAIKLWMMSIIYSASLIFFGKSYNVAFEFS